MCNLYPHSPSYSSKISCSHKRKIISKIIFFPFQFSTTWQLCHTRFSNNREERDPLLLIILETSSSIEIQDFNEEKCIIDITVTLLHNKGKSRCSCHKAMATRNKVSWYPQLCNYLGMFLVRYWVLFVQYSCKVFPLFSCNWNFLSENIFTSAFNFNFWR